MFGARVGVRLLGGGMCAYASMSVFSNQLSGSVDLESHRPNEKSISEDKFEKSIGKKIYHLNVLYENNIISFRFFPLLLSKS